MLQVNVQAYVAKHNQEPVGKKMWSFKVNYEHGHERIQSYIMEFSKAKGMVEYLAKVLSGTAITLMH